MVTFTKTAADVFAPTDENGAPRKISPEDAQTWGEEVEQSLQKTGTWNPTLKGTSADPTYTLAPSTDVGSYVKEGRKVTLFFAIQISTISGGSGNLARGGLPFAPSAKGFNPSTNINGSGGASFSYFNIGGTLPTGFAGVVGAIATSSFSGLANVLRVIYAATTSAGSLDLPVSALAAGGWIIGTAVYLTDS